MSGEQILENHKEQIDGIRDYLSIEQEEFDLFVFKVLIRFANYAHFLPASESAHHSASGGLIAHSIETGLLALKDADKQRIYNNPALRIDPLTKQRNTAVFKIMMFYGGLLHDSGKMLTDYHVQDDTGEKIWDPVEESIYAWAQKNEIDRYFITFKQNRFGKHEHNGVIFFSKIIGPYIRKHLNRLAPGIYDEAMAASCKLDKGDTKMSAIIGEADKKSSKRDDKSYQIDKRIDGATVPIGIHVAKAIADILDQGIWKINERGATVFVNSTAGMFIVWKSAYEDILRAAERRGFRGIPRNPIDFADALVKDGLATAYYKGDHVFDLWPINPDGLVYEKSNKPIYLSAIKIPKVSRFFEDEELSNDYSISIGEPSTKQRHKKASEEREDLIDESVTDKRQKTEKKFNPILDLEDSTESDQDEDLFSDDISVETDTKDEPVEDQVEKGGSDDLFDLEEDSKTETTSENVETKKQKETDDDLFGEAMDIEVQESPNEVTKDNKEKVLDEDLFGEEVSMEPDPRPDENTNPFQKPLAKKQKVKTEETKLKPKEEQKSDSDKVGKRKERIKKLLSNIELITNEPRLKADAEKVGEADSAIERVENEWRIWVEKAFTTINESKATGWAESGFLQCRNGVYRESIYKSKTGQEYIVLKGSLERMIDELSNHLDVNVGEKTMKQPSTVPKGKAYYWPSLEDGLNALWDKIYRRMKAGNQGKTTFRIEVYNEAIEALDIDSLDAQAIKLAVEAGTRGNMKHANGIDLKDAERYLR